MWAPSVADAPGPRQWFARFNRLAVSPGAAAELFRMSRDLDVRAVLPVIRVPTLILHRTDDALIRVEHSRYMAERIPDAKLVELPGQDHLWYFGDQDAIVDEVEEFLTGARSAPEPDRMLATVLFTDIVGSVEKQAVLGDHAWKELVLRYRSIVRTTLERWRGKENDTAGDGFYAAFDGPARAIRCALEVAERVSDLGIEIRAGVHTGECELIEDKCSGLTVSIGARVAAIGGPGQVLVSQTVKDLVPGSGLRFEDAGEHQLKGVPGRWRLHRVVG